MIPKFNSRVAEQDWELVKLNVTIGDPIAVQIAYIKPFGLLVACDSFSFGVIERIGMAKVGYSPEDFEVGNTVDAIVLGFREWSHQVELRLPPKNLRQE